MNLIGGNDEGQLIAVEFGIGNGIGMRCAQGLDRDVLREAFEHSLCIEQRFCHCLLLWSWRLRLEVCLVGGPVEDALFPDVKDAERDEAQVDEHFPEAEHA